MVLRFGRAYLSSLQTHPLRTNSIAAGVIGAVGDGIAQNIERRRQCTDASSWSPMRTCEMAVFCGSWLGAPQSLWFRFLSRKIPEGSPHKLAKTLGVHMGFMAPATNSLFFAYSEMRRGPNDTWSARFAERMRQEFPSTTAYSMCFWVPTHMLTFTLVPLHLRPLYLNTMMVVWTTYLSIAGHRRY